MKQNAVARHRKRCSRGAGCQVGLPWPALIACPSLAASMVLHDQTALRQAQKQEKRTDWVINRWGSRNGRVSELVDLLDCLELLRPRDVILRGEIRPLSSTPIGRILWLTLSL